MVTMSFPLDESQGKNRLPRLLPGLERRLSAGVLAALPEKLLRCLAEISRRRQLPIYFSGGVVRDWLLGLPPADLDLTVPSGALDFAEDLARALGAAYVPLSPTEGVARVVWGSAHSPLVPDGRGGSAQAALVSDENGGSVLPLLVSDENGGSVQSPLLSDGGSIRLDVSQFREGTTTIADDLRRRDFSVNAMAVGFDALEQTLANGGLLIDPLGGLADLGHGVIRLTHPQALVADPLRMLRAFRFQAVFAWRIENETKRAIASQASLIGQVSGERIAYELETIFTCAECYSALKEMATSGLLCQIFPELAAGVGLLQPSSHHLDVFDHSLETLRQIERVILDPAAFFLSQTEVELTPCRPQGGSEVTPRPMEQTPCWGQDMSAYLSDPRQRIRLKYAALLHDLGKTTTGAEKEGRITFYNHDEAGVVLLKGIADRLRWSHEDARRISQLVKQHMWPFHLHNAKVRTGITPRAVLKLVKAAEEDLLGLFFLVMADSLAGQGPGKPAGMEAAVAVLFDEVYQTYLVRLKPIMEKPLLTGHDLIQGLHLTPGPVFKQILDALLEERALDPEMTKERALVWAAEYVARSGKVGAAAGESARG